MYRSCVSCHHEAGPAGFALQSWEQAAPISDLIEDSVSTGSMPPFAATSGDACETRFDWLNDPSLTDEEIVTIKLWDQAGAPEGDPESAAPLPEVPSLELPHVDISYEMVDSGPGGTGGTGRCWLIDPGLETARWLTGVQVHHTAAARVHSVLTQTLDTFTVEEGDDTVGFECDFGDGSEIDHDSEAPPGEPHKISTRTPGAPPWIPPAHTGAPLEPGVALFIHLQYIDSHQPLDPSEAFELRLAWEDEEPLLDAVTAHYGAMGNIPYGLQPEEGETPGQAEFLIPAGAEAHSETIEFTFPSWHPVLRVWGAGGSMGPLGTAMEVWLDRADPRPGEPAHECLVHLQDYDPRWPQMYDYDSGSEDLIEIRGDDTLSLRCTYNNTMDNAHLAQLLDRAGIDEPFDVGTIGEFIRERCLANFSIAQEEGIPTPG